jgi:ribonuclease P protein component
LLLYLYHIEKQFTFNKQQKLKSRKQIEHLFSKGKSFHVSPIKALYDFTASNVEENLQAGVAVSSRNFKKAVDRNRIKRLLREAYRLQKNELQNLLKGRSLYMSVFFIYTGKILPEMTEIMDKIKIILLRLNEIATQQKP